MTLWQLREMVQALGPNFRVRFLEMRMSTYATRTYWPWNGSVITNDPHFTRSG